MRKLDHDKAYSEDDIWFIRQAGWPNSEELIARNAEQFGIEVPEVEGHDPAIPVVGSEAAAGTFIPPDPATSAVRLIDPMDPDGTKSEGEEVADDDGDDYDTWTKPDLEGEVSARNDLADTSDVVVVGTGRDGNVVKADLIKGLRLWDIDNPEAIKA
jgi:hypothetical protein